MGTPIGRLTDNQTLSLAGTILSIEDGNDVDLVGLKDGTGTDDQTLNLTGSTLGIESGNSVNLSAFLDNTDAQNLGSTASGTTRTITITSGTGTTISVADNDNSSTNEIQTLSLTGNTLGIANGNSVDLSGFMDNLGNHMATQNILTGGNWISNDGGNEGLFVDASGSVGIGVNILSERLSVYTNTDVSAEIGRAHIGYVGHNDWASFSHVDVNATGSYALLQNGVGQTLLNSASGQAILFRNNNINVGTFDSNGNFGVGTISPASKLEVTGDVRMTGINSKVIYESKETNGDWRLVYYDSFEGGTESWVANGSLSTGDAGLTRESLNVAGLVGHWIRPNDNNHVLKKFFDMSGMSYSEIKVEFNYIFIDSWDNETGWLAVKGSEGGNPTPIWVHRHGHDDADLELNGTIYNISFYGNGSWSDLKYKSEAQFSWGGGGFWIEFGANLDSDTNDETFAIDNIAIYAR